MLAGEFRECDNRAVNGSRGVNEGLLVTQAGFFTTADGLIPPS
jgi:hypothetical protein